MGLGFDVVVVKVVDFDVVVVGLVVVVVVVDDLWVVGIVLSSQTFGRSHSLHFGMSNLKHFS
jgi:hypothetical protein